MGKGKTLVTALGGVIVGGMLLSGGMVFAGNTNGSVSDNPAGKLPFFGKAMEHRGGKAFGKGDFRPGGGKLSQTTLDQLVKDGVITQDKADKIKAYIEGRPDLFTELVKNNILTQEQADTVKTKIRETADQQQQQRISDSLKTLVGKGTITQVQADKLLKLFADAKKDRDALFEKTKDMSPEERRQYMQDNKEKVKNPISQLVSDGVITQEQADAIQQIFPRKGHRGGRR